MFELSVTVKREYERLVSDFFRKIKKLMILPKRFQNFRFHNSLITKKYLNNIGNFDYSTYN